MKYEAWDIDFAKHEEEYLNLYKKYSLEEFNVENLETRLAKVAARGYAVTVANATDALHFSLLCNNIGPGDEVLVSDFSWISTASCISMVGAIPVFCDIDDDYHISLESIMRMMSPSVKALIYTPLFGNMSDMTNIINFCNQNNIVLIEDSAQAIGSKYNGKPAGSFGDISSYSFNDNKVIGGISGGGVLLTDDKDKAELVTKLRRHGRGEMLGRNSTMYHMNAAIIDFRLNRMQELQSMRQDIAAMYDDAFGIIPNNNVDNNRHKYVYRCSSEDARNQIKDQIRGKIHYPQISKNPMYNSIQHRKDDCIKSEAASKTVVSLPIHPYMEEEEIEKVINTVCILDENF